MLAMDILKVFIIHIYYYRNVTIKVNIFVTIHLSKFMSTLLHLYLLRTLLAAKIPQANAEAHMLRVGNVPYPKLQRFL